MPAALRIRRLGAPWLRSLGSMPIVTVELVGGEANPMSSDLAQQLANAIGRALNSPPGQTWVRLRPLACNQYAENGPPLDASELPVFVTIVKHQASESAELEAEVASLTGAVAQVVARPASCVHIEFAPPAAGRLAFGGTLVR